MNSADNKLKNILNNLSIEVKSRIERNDSMMKECVTNKLTNTLELYESELNNTCNYILIRKPVVIAKSITGVYEKENLIND